LTKSPDLTVERYGWRERFLFEDRLPCPCAGLFRLRDNHNQPTPA
jgi:hypothetical protein